MSPGLAAAQAGHAFLASYLTSSPEEQRAYIGVDGWTKVVLACADEAALRAAHDRARGAGAPSILWTESEVFDEPKLTAVGIGPITRAAAKPIVGGLKLF